MEIVGKLKPHVSHVFPMTEEGCQAAYLTLLDRKVVGRVCVSIGDVTPSDGSKL